MILLPFYVHKILSCGEEIWCLWFGNNFFDSEHMATEAGWIFCDIRLNNSSFSWSRVFDDLRVGKRFPARMSHFLAHLSAAIKSVSTSPSESKKLIPKSDPKLFGLLIESLWSNAINNRQNIVSLIHFCSFFMSTLVSRKRSDEFRLGSILRNSWNWEINRLISRRRIKKKKVTRTLFEMAQASRLPFPVAWACQMMPVQQVSGWLHILSAGGSFHLKNLQPQLHQLTFSASSRSRSTKYLNPKIFLKHEFSRMLTPAAPKNILKSDLEQHGERSHVKMHRGMHRATTFYFGGAKLTS